MFTHRMWQHRAVAVSFACMLAVGFGAVAAQAALDRAPAAAEVSPSPVMPTPPAESPLPTPPIPSPTPVPTPSETCAPEEGDYSAANAVIAALGPFKITAGATKTFSRKDLSVSACALYTGCTIAGRIVRSCTVGGMGRTLVVVCGAAKGKDTLDVTVDEGGTQTTFKVDIECV